MTAQSPPKSMLTVVSQRAQTCDRGETAIRASLKAQRGRKQRAHTAEEADRNRIKTRDALNDAEYALKPPDDVIASSGEAIRRDFRLDYVVDRLETAPDMIAVIASDTGLNWPPA